MLIVVLVSLKFELISYLVIIQGYAFVEYENYEDAKNAIDKLEGSSILGQTIHANWAFIK